MNYSKYHSVIFDVDGTIVDSLGLWREIDKEFLTKRNIDCPDDLQMQIAGKSVDEMAEFFKTEFNIPESLDEIKLEWFLMSFDKYAHHVQAKPGIEKYMRFLKDQGKTMALATSNRPELIIEAFKRLNLWNYIHSMSFSGGRVPGKPDPMVYLLASDHLETRPDKCLAVEDSLDGIKAARNAGMDVIAVREYWPEEEQKVIRELSMFMIDDFNDPRIYEV